MYYKNKSNEKDDFKAIVLLRTTHRILKFYYKIIKLDLTDYKKQN